MHDSTTFSELEDGEAFQRKANWHSDEIYIKDTSGSIFSNAYEAEDPESEEFVNPSAPVERTVQPAN